MKQPLTIDEVLALQYFGMENSEILKMQLNTFEKLLDENPILEEYLDKANSVLDCQEEAGVISYVWTDPEFPERLRRIGSEYPPIIHLKGNISLLRDEKAVAIIGARAADKEGNDVAYRLGKKTGNFNLLAQSSAYSHNPIVNSILLENL
ncbi:MAG: DNA-processing protein DprA [Muribaculaceae bacterium]|nr:DNA-processing protein DprA [Muribaculaceae bacterium]